MNGKTVIQQDKRPYNGWYNGIGTRDESKIIQYCDLYNDSIHGATSMLCTGSCWDKMLEFVEDESHDVLDAVSWGNYGGASFTVFRGEVCILDEYNMYPEKYISVPEEGYEKVSVRFRVGLSYFYYRCNRQKLCKKYI